MDNSPEINKPVKRRSFLKAGTLQAGAALFAGNTAIRLSSATAAERSKSREQVVMETMKPEEMKSALGKCLGGDWPKGGGLKAKIRETIQQDGYRIESLTYEVEPGDTVPAMLLIPDGIDGANSAPAVAVWHQHAGQYHLGKSEPAGLDGNPMHHTGVALVKKGYVVLCPDALCFEERQDPNKKLKKGSYERFMFLEYVLQGKSLAWKNILDMRRAIDYLCDRPEVDDKRIGCYGHSMGSTHAWLVGPWEPRIKCVVGNCCLPTYEAIHNHELLHCFPNFVPGWLQYGDTPEIASLIAPRALHLNLGELDGGSPIVEAKKGLARIADAYKRAKAPDQFTYYIEAGAGHVLSPEMWKLTHQCFAKHL